MIHRISFALYACFALAVVMNSPSNAADGWISLFDGKSLGDWTVKSGFATYEVEDGGVIVGKTAKGSPNSFLTSNQEFGNFEL